MLLDKMTEQGVPALRYINEFEESFPPLAPSVGVIDTNILTPIEGFPTTLDDLFNAYRD